ncbi:amino acid ABC transporter permease [Vulcanibacillus modesticaldus]|uniref:Amino acid ABC transporter permease n=1 Tax=Vulcanibacillus modesticaldus TaxID=337097 RepID=A0A1D2YW90_9BACI|nr:amino acid ABC transporter permease [Vulcanibacillus modesticaldus]OEF99961.1 amino acid ABC transporter permease [Vulcanibacillus modesticaldus]
MQTENKINPQMEMAPPAANIGVRGWLKENLFSSWINTLVTIIFATIIYFIVKGILTWIIYSADWQVVSSNFRLFFVGQYPLEQLWRIWLSLTIVTLLFGFTAGIWKGTVWKLTIFLSIVFLLITLLPFIPLSAKLWLVINIISLYLGYFFINKLPKNKVITVVGWFLSFPIILILINGFNLLAPVSTNLWGGLLLTILIAVVAIVVSFPLGVLLALGRISKLPVIRWFSIAYIELIRGIPLITVLFMAQLMVPLFLSEGIEINNVIRVMIGATMFSAAYVAENVRGGLQSINRGQFEAAKALGLNSVYTMAFIILPQALRAVIPAIVGQFIAMFKDTSLVAIVGLIDLLGIAKTIVANPDFLGKQMEVFLFIALIYWIFSYSMSFASRKLEESLGVGERY